MNTSLANTPTDLRSVADDTFEWSPYEPLDVHTPVPVDTTSPVSLVDPVDRIETAIGRPAIGAGTIASSLLDHRLPAVMSE